MLDTVACKQDENDDHVGPLLLSYNHHFKCAKFFGQTVLGQKGQKRNYHILRVFAIEIIKDYTSM